MMLVALWRWLLCWIYEYPDVVLPVAQDGLRHRPGITTVAMVLASKVLICESTTQHYRGALTSRKLILNTRMME